MATVIRVVHEDGVFKPEEPAYLADKSRLQIVIEPAAPSPAVTDVTGWEAMREFIGLAGPAPTPSETNDAEDHDSILYGRR